VPAIVCFSLPVAVARNLVAPPNPNGPPNLGSQGNMVWYSSYNATARPARPARPARLPVLIVDLSVPACRPSCFSVLDHKGPSSDLPFSPSLSTVLGTRSSVTPWLSASQPARRFRRRSGSSSSRASAVPSSISRHFSHNHFARLDLGDPSTHSGPLDYRSRRDPIVRLTTPTLGLNCISTIRRHL